MNGAGQKETGENETAARLRSILLPLLLLLLLMIIILFLSILLLLSLLRFRCTRTDATDDCVKFEMRRKTIRKDAWQLRFIFEMVNHIIANYRTRVSY